MGCNERALRWQRRQDSDGVNGFKRVLLWLAALFFIVAGANHFRQPELYLDMMPPQLPWPEALNYIRCC